MAGKPEEPPESIVVSAFAGLRNTVSPERLAPGELELAVNIDIDDAGQVRRRRGQTRKAVGDFHSLWAAPGGRVLVVRDGQLGLLASDYTLTVIDPDAGAAPVGYVEVGDTIFYSSRDVSGKILGDNSRVGWGAQDGSTRWVSPVVRPTETLGAISGRMLAAPPKASLLGAWNGRIYLADGPYLWATELFLFDYVDKTRNFLQFESEITVLAAVDDGIYVGTQDALYFLTGQFGKGMVRRTALLSPVVRGSAVRLPTNLTEAGLKRGGDTFAAVMLLAQAGVITCMSNGQVQNATTGRVEFPVAQEAAAAHREDAGVSSYVSVLRSSGGPATNTRIGDFADAEIRRAQGN